MPHRQPSLAFIPCADGEAAQQVLAAFVAGLPPQVRIAGLIEHGPRRRSRLRLLAGGGDFAVFQPLGSGSGSCALDADSLVRAGAQACADIAVGCDLAVLSKFGKLEAEAGSGLVPAFITAIEAGVPVLTTVADKYRAGWQAFAVPFEVELEPNAEALAAWWDQVSRIAAEG